MVESLPDQPPQGAWSAVDLTDLIGSQRHIEVTGTVTAVLTDRVFLQMADPQGDDPTDLVLDLVERRPQPAGGHAMGPREVHFAHDVSRQQYDTVTVRRNGRVEAHLTVAKTMSLAGR